MVDDLRRSLDRLLELGDRRMEEIGPQVFLLVLLLSLASALLVAWLYRRFYGGRATGTDMQRAFPLLGLSITAIFICIQFSLPLSLGLLGALSIVRFRTPVKEPEEIGFLMVVIATSLACATFNFTFLLVILVLAAAAAVLQDLTAPALGGGSSGVVLVSLPVERYEEKGTALLEHLSRSIRRGRIESLTRGEEEVVISYSFRAMDPGRVAELERSLAALAAPSRLTVTYQRPGP